MPDVKIQMENLRLVLQTPEETLASIEALSPADKAQVSPDWLARVRASTGADPWTLGFTVVHRASATGIGSCGYKGPQTRAGPRRSPTESIPITGGRGTPPKARRRW